MSKHVLDRPRPPISASAHMAKAAPRVVASTELSRPLRPVYRRKRGRADSSSRLTAFLRVARGHIA